MAWTLRKTHNTKKKIEGSVHGDVQALRLGNLLPPTEILFSYYLYGKAVIVAHLLSTALT